jgi:GNAT superfamily N-acetyltransferase
MQGEEIDTTPEALRQYTARDRLLDGRTLLVRAIHPDDKPALLDGLRRLSAESAYARFFQLKRKATSNELSYFTEVDFASHVALVGIVEGASLIVGAGRYVACEDIEGMRSAEIAFAVDDAHQGLGIGTILLRHLVKIARSAGVSKFRASVLSGNLKMLRLFSRSGLPQEQSSEGGVVNVRMFLVEAPAARNDGTSGTE